eukprot:4267984-Pleurochrysis_carterae.AAC.9
METPGPIGSFRRNRLIAERFPFRRENTALQALQICGSASRTYICGRFYHRSSLATPFIFITERFMSDRGVARQTRRDRAARRRNGT